MQELLLAILSRQKAGLTDFVVLLQKEQNALTQGLADELPAISQGKTALIEMLNTADRERQTLLAKAGFPDEKNGITDWLERQGRNTAPLGLWNEILELAREAKRLNQLNGQVIAVRLQATEQALSALNVRAKETSLYGPRGQTGSVTGNRIIDSA